MSDEDELKPVEIDLDAPEIEKKNDSPGEPDEKPVEKAAEAPPPPEKAAEGNRESALEDLKAQIEAHKRAVAQERAAREAAERQAREYESRVGGYESEAQDHRLTAINNALRAVQAEADSAERIYADALAEGNHAQAAKAQRAIAALEARALQLENGKAAIEDAAQARQRQPAPIPRQQPAEDPIEAWANQLTPQSAAWVRQHRDRLADPAVQRRVAAAHSAAIELEGLEAESPEYFRFVEERLGMRKSETKPAEPAAPARKPVPSAPVGAGGAGGGRSERTMTLTAEMRSVAHNLYPELTPAQAEKQYALDRAALIKEGKISA